MGRTFTALAREFILHFCVQYTCCTFYTVLNTQRSCQQIEFLKLFTLDMCEKKKKKKINPFFGLFFLFSSLTGFWRKDSGENWSKRVFLRKVKERFDRDVFFFLFRVWEAKRRCEEGRDRAESEWNIFKVLILPGKGVGRRGNRVTVRKWKQNPGIDFPR